jgi:hypothetical protein
VRAVPRKASAAVRLYLERAANASEKAATVAGPAMQRFSLAMESKWIDLAASIAVVERVNLFLQTREFRLRLLSSDLCTDCHQRMLLETIQTTAEHEEHAFRRGNCLRAYATFSLR